MCSFVEVKQEVTEEECETFILPDRADINDIKQELHMELADGEDINKETDDQLQPSCSRNSTQSEGKLY